MQEGTNISNLSASLLEILVADADVCLADRRLRPVGGMKPSTATTQAAATIRNLDIVVADDIE